MADFQIPDVFRNNRIAQAFAGLNPVEDKLSDGIGASFPVIHFKGKIWSITYRGDRKTVTRPDDGTPSGFLDVIILGQARNRSKTYYPGTYDSNSDGTRPTCQSIDGVVPDPDVVMKQSETCALCPRNEWKTFENGRKGRECSDNKRLAVLVRPTQTQPLFSQPLMEPMLLRVPPDSLQSLAMMGDSMAAQGFHYSTYLTRITFDPQKAHPSMLFRPVQPLKDAEAQGVMELRQDPLINRITGSDVAEQRAVPSGLTAVNIGKGAQRQQATTTVTPPKPAPVVLENDEQGSFFGNGQEDFTVPAAKVSAPAPAKKKAAAKPKPVEEPQQEAAPIGADAGVSEGGDDALDAEIAKLISK